MSGLPVVSGVECVRALSKIGFRIRRQVGSHIIVRRDEPFCQIVIPNHSTIDRGTLRAILRDAALDVEEFKSLIIR